MTLMEELTQLINRYSAENESDTPDFVLAQFLMLSLEAFNTAVRQRDQWWSFKPWNHDDHEKI